MHLAYRLHEDHCYMSDDYTRSAGKLMRFYSTIVVEPFGHRWRAKFRNTPEIECFGVSRVDAVQGILSVAHSMGMDVDGIVTFSMECDHKLELMVPQRG